jgi:hypothetical protein
VAAATAKVVAAAATVGGGTAGVGASRPKPTPIALPGILGLSATSAPGMQKSKPAVTLVDLTTSPEHAEPKRALPRSRAQQKKCKNNNNSNAPGAGPQLQPSSSEPKPVTGITVVSLLS